MKKISVVIPAFNEEDCVDELAVRLAAMATPLYDRYEFEFVIIENGSKDATFEKLLVIHRADPRFKIIRLLRNFGIEGAITAGLRCIDGDAAVIMCADLQDPPELIPTFIERWEAGFDNVYGVIVNRSDEGKLRQFLTKCFYWLANRVNEQPTPPNVSDFRLVDRGMYSIMNQLHEKSRMLRAMWAWIGGKSIGVPFDRPPRHGGRSTYAIFGNIGFALRGLMSSSTTPLKAIPYFGVALSAFSFLVLIVFAIRWLSAGVPFNGFGTLLAFMLLMFGLLFLLLGMVSGYVGLIFEEVRSRPIFIARDRFGLDTVDAMSSSGRDKAIDPGTQR